MVASPWSCLLSSHRILIVAGWLAGRGAGGDDGWEWGGRDGGEVLLRNFFSCLGPELRCGFATRKEITHLRNKEMLVDDGCFPPPPKNNPGQTCSEARRRSGMLVWRGKNSMHDSCNHPLVQDLLRCASRGGPGEGIARLGNRCFPPLGSLDARSAQPAGCAFLHRL